MTTTDHAVFESAARRYALGALDDGQSLEVEERLVTDPAAYDILLAVGDDLMEEYLDDTLAAEDRRRFEAHFLAMPEHRDRLQLLRALRSKASSLPARVVTRARGFATAAVVVIGASAAMGTWFVVNRGATAPGTATSQVPATLPGASQGPPTTAPGPAGSSQAPAVVAGPQPTAAAGPASVASGAPAPAAASPDTRLAQAAPPTGLPEFRLRGGLTRGAGTLPRVDVPAGAPAVRLVLETDSPVEAGTYRVVIEDVDGEPVYSASLQRATAGAAPLSLRVPADRLESGDYRLVLATAGEGDAAQTIATFPFRVIARR